MRSASDLRRDLSAILSEAHAMGRQAAEQGRPCASPWDRGNWESAEILANWWKSGWRWWHREQQEQSNG